MTTEKTTETTGVFDTWVKDGRFSAEAFKRENSLTRIRQAVESAHVLAGITTDVSMPENVKVTDNESLMVYLAHVASELGETAKRFGAGKRTIVYFALSYATDIPDNKERVALIAKMPALFKYQLGSTPTKAWRDMLSNVNTMPHMARSVGKSELPQAIFARISAAVSKVASGYTDPQTKRVVVRAFYDDYWREHNTFHTETHTTLTKPTMTDLVGLWNHRHPEEVGTDRTKRQTAASKEKRQLKTVDDILLGKADEDALTKLDKVGQAKLAKRIKSAGFNTASRPELLALESALCIDHARKDAIGVLESAVDVLRKLDIEISTLLQFARDHASKKTEAPELPSVNCKRASFAKAFRLSGKEVSDLDEIDMVTLSRQSNDIHKVDVVGHPDDSGNVFSTVVTSKKMYTFRNTREAIQKKNEFVVTLS